MAPQKPKAGAFAPAFGAASAALFIIVPELGRSCGSYLLFMDWVDNAVSNPCHEIFGIIAVQHRQVNYAKVKLTVVLVGAVLFAVKTTQAGTIAQPSDPLLVGTQNPCMAAPDYVPGVDASGNEVPPADGEIEKTPVPGQVLVPLHNRHGAAAVLDGKAVAPLLAPAHCAR